MSTFYSINSLWRDVAMYPSPADFEIPTSVSSKWTMNRTVQATRTYCENVPINFVYNVALTNLTLPASFTTTAYGSNPPYLYVEFRNVNKYNDKRLINTNETDTDITLKDAVFVVYFDKLIDDVWAQFKCTMVQTYRIDPQAAMKFRVFDDQNETVIIVDTDPPSPELQVSALIQMTPYVREDTRESHFYKPICS